MFKRTNTTPSIIVFEGPDGIGKDAFIAYETAKSRKPVKVFSYTSKDANTAAFWIEQLLKWSHYSQEGYQVLVNRSYFSELIYSNILVNRKCRLTEDDEENLTSLMKTFDVKLIVLLPKNTENTYTQLKIRGDNEEIISKWHLILEEYEILEQYIEEKRRAGEVILAVVVRV